VRNFLFVATLAIAIFASGASAQFRTVPPSAKLARVGNAHPLPLVQLDGNILKLAPGGVIYDENNRSILHGALQPGARVAYTLDMSGDVARIYILSVQELAQIEKKK
jgi:hypothetical protein